MVEDAQSNYDENHSSENITSLLKAKESLEHALNQELSILHQHSRLLNLNIKDMESKYFYNKIKLREHQNKIAFVLLSDGSLSVEPLVIESTFVKHFESSFGGESTFNEDDITPFFQQKGSC